ncbi:MAG: DNA alkylation repair protein [Deltaproteobacteria bacterium]|nr:DNA alkylation repair protein [Deltaproteobacteria bacterium]
MEDKKEVANLIYEELKKGNIKSNFSFILKELKEKKIPFVGSVGKELGKIILKDNFQYERLFYDLWEFAVTEEKDRFGISKNFIIFCLLINALGEISKKDYKKTKGFVIKILPTLNDWATVDTLATRVVANLATQNQKDIFSLMYEWIRSENKWVKRLAVATIPSYIKTKKKESKICLDFLDIIMKEEDKHVKKAIGWALREITKKDSGSVFDFLLKWSKINDKNTRWIVKDGMKKLPKNEQEKLNSLFDV